MHWFYSIKYEIVFLLALLMHVAWNNFVLLSFSLEQVIYDFRLQKDSRIQLWDLSCD